MTGTIYGLCGPEGIRYVGQTRRRLRDRYRAHQRAAENGSPLRVHRWWRTQVQPPAVVVLAECPVDALNRLEIAWIARLRLEGIDLCNLDDGGASGIPGVEARARMSAAQKGRVATAETRAKLSAVRRGTTKSPEWRERISEGLRTSEKAKKQRGLLSVEQTGKTRSLEARARMAAAQKQRYAAMDVAARKALTANANDAWRARSA